MAFSWCSGDRGLKLHSRKISRSHAAHPKVRKVGAWGLPCPCAECTRGGFSRFWAPKKQKGRWVRKCILQTRIVDPSPPVGGGYAHHRPPGPAGHESRGCCAILFVPRCPWVERVWRDPKLRASSSWGCSVVGRSTTSLSLGWTGAMSRGVSGGSWHEFVEVNRCQMTGLGVLSSKVHLENSGFGLAASAACSIDARGRLGTTHPASSARVDIPRQPSLGGS